MIKNKLKGFTLIEMTTTLTIASAFSLGLYFVFLNANKAVTNEEVVYDVKSYSTAALDIISEKIRNADQIEINSQFGGGTTITTTNKKNGDDEVFQYSIVNNMVYENALPMKLFGYRHIENQDLYDITLTLTCVANADVENTYNQDVEDNIYDLNITVNIESKINTNYQVEHTSSNRIFTINKFSQITANS